MEDVDTGAIIDVLRSELNAYAQHKKGSTVLLSGGFDSRLAIAMMHQEGWEPTALILGHQDELFGADAMLAKSIVKRLGLHSTIINTPRDFYRTSCVVSAGEITTLCGFRARNPIISGGGSVPTMYGFSVNAAMFPCCSRWPMCLCSRHAPSSKRCRFL